MFWRMRYEHWPFWLFYFPFLPLWLYWSLRCRRLTYFAAVNPSIEWGGFFEYSKFDLLEKVHPDFKPEQKLLQKENQNNFSPNRFPFIAKPNIGERGVGVEKIKSEKDWEQYKSNSESEIIVQELIDLPMEAGLFFVKKPWKKRGKIISITGKNFLQLIGDNKTSIQDFIETNNRATLRKKYLLNKFKDRLNNIPKEGEVIVLEEIGNHNRGTEFIHSPELWSKELEEKCNELLNPIDGFYYGRLDVKFANPEKLKKGEFITLELNGANSEPTHIYDPKFKLFEAYHEVYRHLNIQYQISKYNIKKGTKTPSFKEFVSIILARHF